MKYTALPHTNIKISKICLGTMTWGRQNTQEEGFAQMDYALDQGVNFFDTAELYPVPATPELYAQTEIIIGNWFKKTGNRDKVVLASKIIGRVSNYTKHIRSTGFSPDSLRTAVEDSLKRLQTDYLDLYQLHWPERVTNTFGKRDYTYDSDDAWTDNFNAVLTTLDELIKQGKIKHIGISNERSWGVMRFLEESKQHNLPRMITIQNPYSLLNRTFEGDLAEISIRENIGLLAYSPMAFGVLSGKYIKKEDDEKSRLNMFPTLSRYNSENSRQATLKYLKLADEYGISLAQMSLAFVNSRPFVTSNIIGATSLKQLKENIKSINLELSEDILNEIDKIHSIIPNPAP